MGATKSLPSLLCAAALVAALSACRAPGELPSTIASERIGGDATVGTARDEPAFAQGADPFCPQAGFYTDAWEAQARALPLDTPRSRARAFVRGMSTSTGVFLPPDDDSAEWSLGILSDEPVAERSGPEDTREFAFPFECPSRSDWVRVVRVWPDGAVVLLYPPARMPGWQPLAPAPTTPPTDVPHPEIVGLWDSHDFWASPFFYDGRGVVLQIYMMRPWDFRTEDWLQYFRARWDGAVLQIESPAGWRDLAKVLADGSFVRPIQDAEYALARVPNDDSCRTGSWFRPRPILPDDIPLYTGPIMMRCGGSPGCTTNQQSLVDYVCAMHGITR